MAMAYNINKLHAKIQRNRAGTRLLTNFPLNGQNRRKKQPGASFPDVSGWNHLLFEMILRKKTDSAFVRA